MTRMIELTDLIEDLRATVPVEDVAEQLRRWHPADAPTDVLDAIEELQAALLVGAYEARELAAFLAVGFEEVQSPSDQARRELSEGPAIVGRTSLHRGAWFNR